MKNVLMVTVDSLRADACGFVGDGGQTPYLSSLADDGVVYENAIAPGPRTPCSVPVSHTGEPERNSAFTSDERWAAIGRHVETHTTIPEQFKQLGYQTIGFTANPWTAYETNFDAGFDEFYELRPGADNGFETLPDVGMLGTVDDILTGTKIGDRFKWRNRREWFAHWTAFYKEIEQKLSDMDEPYFAWVFVMDTHQPYILPSEFRTETNLPKTLYSLMQYERDDEQRLPSHVVKWLKEAYRDCVRSADRFVERLYKNLQSPETLLVFNADHGEAHGEHGTFGHEYQLYEENIHVPFLVHGLGECQTIKDPLSLTRLPQLLEHFATESRPNPASFTDKFVVSDVESHRFSKHRAELNGYAPHFATVRSNDLKYIDTASGAELYDLSADPDETDELSREHPELVELLSELTTIRTVKPNEKLSIVQAIQKIHS
ncbi:sulfatase-like hydrolase/transferase [Haloarchaeobius sp. HME9146]|uniref:sulfatase-like hydrolase/transferase n=1 Tax=Haloarchaeobius sp. HME9146 TaxID=2978732 RepID=UPI0021C0A492|nr:sulfatase-like hydrolase/transferase [Haloarchaeobius sp. HME9146]MCT9098181.1 sulfatase-like hydrolase/transferase [Haloarchaeobius sp. HME9146]